MNHNSPWLDVLFTQSNKQKPKTAGLSGANSYPKPSLPDMLRCAAGLPQAILKVTGFGHGMQSVKAHLSYISRKGSLPLVDQDGRVLDKEEQAELLNDWARDFGKKKNSRDTMKMMLSSPKGTQADKLAQASAAFLHENYGQTHPYVYTLHEDTNKPHVHASVRMMSYFGRKLDPDKQHLYGLRKSFAKHCREQGILVEASPRFERGMLRKSQNISINQLRQYRPKNSQQDISQHAIALEKNPQYYAPEHLEKARNWYQQAAVQLSETGAQTQHPKDKQAQQLLAKHAQSLQAAQERAGNKEREKNNDKECEHEL